MVPGIRRQIARDLVLIGVASLAVIGVLTVTIGSGMAYRSPFVALLGNFYAPVWQVIISMIEALIGKGRFTWLLSVALAVTLQNLVIWYLVRGVYRVLKGQRH